MLRRNASAGTEIHLAPAAICGYEGAADLRHMRLEIRVI